MNPQQILVTDPKITPVKYCGWLRNPAPTVEEIRTTKKMVESQEWDVYHLSTGEFYEVVSKLALVPGATQKSVSALKTCTSNVTRPPEAT
jgi:hypothetical protein